MKRVSPEDRQWLRNRLRPAPIQAEVDRLLGDLEQRLQVTKMAG